MYGFETAENKTQGISSEASAASQALLEDTHNNLPTATRVTFSGDALPNSQQTLWGPSINDALPYPQQTTSGLATGDALPYPQQTSIIPITSAQQWPYNKFS
jgi:hypothetical protein